jgi:hypothetical protein
MNYGELPVLITCLAAIYLMSVYGLLRLAALLLKSDRPSPKEVGKANN